MTPPAYQTAPYCLVATGILLAAFILGLSVIYFLPTIVGRKKKNAGAIFCLNLLLGWTGLGWIMALVWASCID